jgi:hypothetical protein
MTDSSNAPSVPQLPVSGAAPSAGPQSSAPQAAVPTVAPKAAKPEVKPASSGSPAFGKAASPVVPAPTQTAAKKAGPPQLPAAPVIAIEPLRSSDETLLEESAATTSIVPASTPTAQSGPPSATQSPATTPAPAIAKTSSALPAASKKPRKTTSIITAVDNGVPLPSDERWSRRLLRQTPGFLVSLFLHLVILLSLSLIVLPAKDRAELFSTIISENIVPEEVNEKLDDSSLVPDVVDGSIPKLEIDSQVVSEKPSALDLDVSDAAPQLEALGTDLPGIGNGPNIPKGELAGRSQKARGAMVASQGGTSGSEKAVNGGLKWLARHQKPDGSWSFKHGDDDPGTIDNPTGATGLALLAFLGCGHTHKTGDYQKQVNSGLNYLINTMKTTGAGGDLRMPNDGQGMYTQGICTIALCEAYALSKDKALKQPTQLALNFIVNAQDLKGGGWRYQPGQKGDTSVVGWQVMALKSAKIAKLQVPTRTISKATFFLNSVQTENGSKYGYDAPGGQPGTSAVGLLCRMYLGWTQKNAGLVKGVEFLGSVGPQPSNIYFDYYATQVMHHWGGEPWTKWNNVMREYLVTTQEKEGDAAGSWKPVGAGHDDLAGGRLYRTCMSIMTLEVYYRHLPIYQRESIKVEL